MNIRNGIMTEVYILTSSKSAYFGSNRFFVTFGERRSSSLNWGY